MSEDSNEIDTMEELGKTLARRAYHAVQSSNSRVYVEFMSASPDGGVQNLETFFGLSR